MKSHRTIWLLTAGIVIVALAAFLFALGKGFVHVRAGRVALHREWMIRAFAVALAIAGLMRVGYLLLCVGAAIAVLVLIPQHISLRLSRRERDDGDDGEPELAAGSSGTFTEI